MTTFRRIRGGHRGKSST